MNYICILQQNTQYNFKQLKVSSLLQVVCLSTYKKLQNISLRWGWDRWVGVTMFGQCGAG